LRRDCHTLTHGGSCLLGCWFAPRLHTLTISPNCTTVVHLLGQAPSQSLRCGETVPEKASA
jgi:hypothetical protein